MLPRQTFIIPTLTLRPHWLQIIIDELCIILLMLASLVVACITSFMFHWWILVITALCALFIFCKVISILCTEYVVTGEQIIIIRGVLVRSTDYVELYRVVDYQQRRNLLQQFMGLKDVTIYSGDRNNPVLTMTGVREVVDVVSEIRQREEFNKKRRGIYEFTNQS